MLLLLFQSSGATSTTGTAAGSSSFVAIGRAINPAVLAASGVGSATGVGRAIKTATLASASVGALSGSGSGFRTSTAVMSGVGSASFVKLFRAYTSNRIIQLPVDVVLAGDKQTTRKGSAKGRALKHAFGE